MTEWKEYTEETTLLKMGDTVSKDIVNALGLRLSDFWEHEKQYREKTKIIKDVLTSLGKGNGYKVYANGLSKEGEQTEGEDLKNRELLYDLNWYEEDEPYLITNMPLVVECEWKQVKSKKIDRKGTDYSGIKYDFQKLLLSNAGLRLMIFRVKKDEDLVELGKYFDKAIKDYKNLASGSKFIFIGFDKRRKGFHYCEKSK